MTCRWLARLFWASGLVVPLLLGSSQQAAAQAPPAQPQTAEEKAKQEEEAKKKAEKEGVVRLREEVSVTGSLIPREDVEALSPVAVVPAQELTYTGTSRVEDLIQALPQVFAAQNSSRSNGASGSANAELRHLDPVRTLALINGRRMAAGDASASGVAGGADLNAIPSMLVKRVDVLTGGASSAYGADAVAGVVNFVLDTEFEGFRGSFNLNGFQHNNNDAQAAKINQARGFTFPSGNAFDYGGTNFNLAVGGKFGDGKGHATAYVDYRDIGDVTKDARDYTNCSVSGLGPTSVGPRCGGSSTSATGRFFVFDRDFNQTGDYTVTGNSFTPFTSANLFNFAPYNFMQRNDTRWSGGAFAHYTLAKAAEPYAELMFMNDYTNAQIAPSGNFGNTFTINCDNPMLSAQQFDLLCTRNGFGPNDIANVQILRRNVEGGPRVDQLTHTNWRLLAGIRGDINPTWHYDVYGMNATVSVPESYINDLSISRIADALNVVGTRGDPSTWRCASGNAGCVPWNIFSTGGVTRAATDYISTPLISNSGTGTKYLAATMRGDLEKAGLKLPSATEGLQLAFGGWVSKNSLFITTDDNYRLANAAGQGGPRLPVDGSYTTKEGYAELRVPLVQDTVGAKDLGVELGYRFMNYKAQDQPAKNNSSYKFMGFWSPVQGLRFRGGYSRAVRAPNVYELFQQQGLDLQGNTDICAGPNPVASFEQCARTGVTQAQYGRILVNPASQYNSYDGGNPLLDVEKANTITAGFVWTPKSITGLSVTGDYYDIHVMNTITTIVPDDTIRVCAQTGNPVLCNLIHRDRFGSLWQDSSYPNGAYTIDTNQNFGDRFARGLDVSANYPWNLGSHGFIAFSLLGTTMLEDRHTIPGILDYDCLGFYGNTCGIPDPKWRHRLRATWNTNFKTTFSVNWRFINHVLTEAASPEADLGSPSTIAQYKANGSYEIPTFHYLDFAATYKLKDKVRWTIGCNNLFDKEPPLGSGSSFNDYAAGQRNTYDPLGRTLYTSIDFEF